MTCHNEGFVTMVNGQCQCYCPDGLDPATGCQTILKQISAPAEFPGGQYAMLAPKEGCPADGQFQTGSLVHFHYKANSYNPFLLQGSMSAHLKSEFRNDQDFQSEPQLLKSHLFSEL
nr:hypothetical protein BaRGS_018532 [Batillaria attramentaria]